MNKIRNENGEITTDNTEIQRIIRDLIVYSPPDSSAHGILQVRILE